MNYTATRERLQEYRAKIAELRKEMRATQAAVEPEPVRDYVFTTSAGEVRLSQLFADKHDLFVIHNMGTTCPSCTMWADGFNGIYQHLADRAAFVVISGDAPSVQRKFAADRGWRFPMASCQANTFSADMGYSSPEEPASPGISVFQRNGDQIVRVSDAEFGPHDDFCTVWHCMDLLPDGTNGFRPKFRYFSS
jgi:predicted dithiol-disulfide oxidoreductase (DUF899 family)